MARVPKIAIIGGGIGGLAAARALQLRGIEVTVHEQAPRLSEVGAGVVTTPNAMKALRALGVEDAVLASAFASRRQVVRSWRSGRIIDQTRLDRYRDRFGAPFCTMHRGDLLEALRAAVGDAPIRLNARCVEVSSDARGAHARFADGSAVEADAIVGADGIHSAVRTSLFGAEHPRFTGYVCWRGLVATDRLPQGLAPPDMTAWWGPHGHVVHYHVRRGELLNWVAHTETVAWTEESWSREGDMDEVMRTYAGWNPKLLALFAATERCYKWALYDREPLDHWTVGRATLLGDSAHAMLPYLAQGAAQAIEDGCVLASEIARTPDDIATALQRYEALRIPRTRRIQLGARARGRDNHLPSAWARLKRDTRLALRRWFRPNATLHQAEWIFAYDAARDGG
ncbi:MAG: FAD-dependent monooxygenase [Proteobacteria bacterium]|nr:FAD-dependent monooxygenase [Pseudomonadota bacterium]